VIPKDYKGVSRKFDLALTEDTVISITQLSRISDELENSSLFAPPFYVYILITKEKSDAAQYWRQSFGRKLWNSIDNWIKGK
jgi:hypothetical protein